MPWKPGLSCTPDGLFLQSGLKGNLRHHPGQQVLAKPHFTCPSCGHHLDNQLRFQDYALPQSFPRQRPNSAHQCWPQGAGEEICGTSHSEENWAAVGTLSKCMGWLPSPCRRPFMRPHGLSSKQTILIVALWWVPGWSHYSGCHQVGGYPFSLSVTFFHSWSDIHRAEAFSLSDLWSET